MRLLLLLPLLLSTLALADDGAFLRCRGMTDATARLACYDALPLPSNEAKPELAQPAAPMRETPEQFGLPPPQKAAAAELDTIESTIPGHFSGWHANSRIRLANGQVWQVVDDSSRVVDLTDPKVTIRRGLLTAYYLEFESFNQTARVKRLQ